MRRTLTATWLLLAASAVGCSQPEPQRVVLITIDTLRADRLGCYGNPDGLTPNLDRVASEGTLFEDASAPAPVTLPSHASILTGRYPSTTGVRNNGTFVLPDGETTLAEVLSERGWQTAAVIAAYPLLARYGLSQGFDSYDDRIPRRTAGPTGSAGRYFPERDAKTITDRAIESWDAMAGGPAFLWVHYFDPHAPYAPPDAFAPEEDDPVARYDAEVAYTDFEIGRLLEHLDAGDGVDVLIVTSDHGEGLEEHDEKTHGVFLYQTTIRAPLLIRAPGSFSAGRRVSEPVSLVDIAPTVANLVGAGPLDSIDGADLAGVIDGDSPVVRPVYAESLLPWFDFRFAPQHMLRAGPMKYVASPDPELFDLSQDPAEMRNLSGGHPDEGALAADLDAWLGQHDDAAANRASASLDAEARANLQSLGYVAAGGSAPVPEAGALRDPKSMRSYIRRYDRAVGLMSSGDLGEALTILQELQAEAPENDLLPLQIAAGQITAGRVHEALETLDELVTRVPDLHAAHVMRGELRGVLGEVEASRAAFAEAIRTAPWSAEPHFQLGAMLESTGRFDDAATAYLDAVRLEPTSFEYADRLIRLRMSRGDVDAAVDDLASLRAADPDRVALAVLHARALRAAGSGVEAEAALDDALTRDPGYRPARIERAVLWASLGRDDDARTALDSILASGSDRAEPFVVLGSLYERRGDRAAAAEAYGRALEIEPGHSAARASLARLGMR